MGEGQRAENPGGAAAAGGAGGDAEMDCCRVTHGHLDACGEPAPEREG